MLDELHKSCVFSKINLKVDIIKLDEKKVMNEKLHLKLCMVCMNG